MSIMHLEVEKAWQVMQTLQQVLQNMEAEMERARRDVGRLQSVWQGPAAEEFFYRFQAWWKQRRTVTEDLQRLVKDGLQEIEEWVRVAERFEGGSAGSDPQSPQVFLRNRKDEGLDPWEAIPQTPVPKDGDRTVRIRAGENQGDTQAREASPGPAAPESGTASRGEAGGIQSQSVANRTQTERSGAPAGSTSTAGGTPGAVAGSSGGAGDQGALGASVQGREMPGGRLRIGGDVNVQDQTPGGVFDTRGDMGASGSGVTNPGRGAEATDAIGGPGSVGGSGGRTVVDRGGGFAGGGGGGGGGAAVGGGTGGVGGGAGSGGSGSGPGGAGGAGSPGLESPDVAPDASVETPPEEMTTPMEGQESAEDVGTPLSGRGWAMLSGLGAGVLLSGAAYAVYRALRKEQPEELMDEAEATQIFPADLWDEDLEDMDDLGDEATNMSADATVADPAWASSDEQDYFRQAS